MDDKSLETRLNNIQAALKQKGYRLTSSRQKIVQSLLSCGGHITADGLLEVIHETDKTVGRMTVYRTLELLSELGLIRPVYQGTGAAHYILLDGGHHHHLICSGCDAVIEFDECGLQDVGKLLAERFNFAIEGHLVEFYGRCHNCQ
ncbi:MAG: transcriptional repressor [Anaerolineales bacterium]|nr:transcriptional repressor [Anaerolineales bacterium]MCB8940152.1 transcriptional repressor [Ardenticatenaceae bacterium]